MSVEVAWQTRYREKVVNADMAVRKVRRGHRVFIGSGAAEPQSLVEALTRRGRELADTEIIHILTLGLAPYAEAKFASNFRHNALFIGSNVRNAILEGRADYTPIFLSEIPRLFRTGRVPVDVALIMVSPPDENGLCSYGVSVDIVKAATESAGIVIAEVNQQMPRTLGDSFINVSQIDYLVETDAPILESSPPSPDDVASEIGRHVAQLVEDGSTLQMGIGSIPHAVLQYLKEKKDLGVHTEMLSDGIIELVESGVINGTKKTVSPGKIVSSFCIGTRRLYDYVDNNPLFEFRPVEFTNDPSFIAQNTKMVAINAALEVDLTGQVCADSIGFHFYSGIGGQVDFMRGAARSEGGKPIIVLRSTAKDGTISRIVPHLKEGAGVVTTRGDVHYVVTEYGIADLWGKSVRERALALISIAHPRFREELLAEAKLHHLVYDDQIISLADYPEEWEKEEIARDGTRIFFRPVRATDESLMKEMFYSCSDRSLYERFFMFVKTMPHAKLQQMANVDYKERMAVVGLVREAEQERMVAMGIYAHDPETNLADTGFIVRDDYQGRGIGTLLLCHLIRIAQVQGIAGFTADVLAENHAMMELLRKSGYEMKLSLTRGVYHSELHFDTAQKGTVPAMLL